MANIELDATKIAVVFVGQSEIYPVKLASTVTAGQPLYRTTSGTYAPADANAAGLQQATRIALSGGSAGQVISGLKRGFVAGYTVDSINCDTVVYVSDDVGRIGDSAGTLAVPLGRVDMLGDGTKGIIFDISDLAKYS